MINNGIKEDQLQDEIFFRKLKIMNRWIASFLFNWTRMFSEDLAILQMYFHQNTNDGVTTLSSSRTIFPNFNLFKIFNYSWPNSIIWVLEKFYLHDELMPQKRNDYFST